MLSHAKVVSLIVFSQEVADTTKAALQQIS